MKLIDQRPQLPARPHTMSELPYGFYYGSFSKSIGGLFFKSYNGLTSLSSPGSTWGNNESCWDGLSTEQLQLVDVEIQILRNL